MSNDDPEKPPAPDDGPDPLAFSMSRRISDEEAHQLAALIKGKLAALFDQLKKDATPAAAGFFQGDNVDLKKLSDVGLLKEQRNLAL